MTRLTDNDRHFGKYITYGTTDRWRPIRAVLSSGGDDEGDPFSSLTVYAFGWIARLRLPRIISPYREKVQAKYWDAATIKRLGRDWYWSVDRRDFGFSYSEGFLQVYYGRQTGDSTTDKTWSKSMPWTNWHTRRLSIYDADGNLFWKYLVPYGIKGMPYWEEMYRLKEGGLLPQMAFTIDDNGTAVLATTTLEETEHSLGTGRWAWLRFFRRNRVRRSLKIEFNQEVGNEKGSWKGGLVGTSIDVRPGEDHEGAMRRWCAQEHRDKGGKFKVYFVGRVS